MPPRIPPGDVRSVYWYTRLGDDDTAFRELAASRDLTPGALLTSLAVADLERQAGYRDTARRDAPRQRSASKGRPEDNRVWAGFSAEEARRARRILGGMSPYEWLRGLAGAALGHEVAPRKRVTRARPDPDRKPLPKQDWPEHPTPEQKAGRLATITRWRNQGYPLSEIGDAYGITHQGVSRILQKQKEQKS